MRNKIGTITCIAVVLMSAHVAQADRNPPPQTPPSAPSQSPTPQTSAQQPAQPNAAMPSTPQAVLDDVKQTAGFVPDFFKAIPDSMVVSFWSMMKGFQMNPNTALDGKSKELIGLAVAAQIPCEYCIYFHTQAAKKAGATDQEIKEAVGMAAMTRMASTVLNGGQIDRMAFRRDVDKMMKGDTKTKVQARVP
ncbi:MAG TPA: carboxymuconolactone decarboxylase family protein [Kofleriaceae bacterium]|nr:carboxymuconolactone decarboxylase family protein [Kofleriaceae bacterium]